MDANTDTDTNVDIDMRSLSSYLSHIRRLVVRPSTLSESTNNVGSSGEKVTLVMGNPSADLDSFVSALVLSYFYNLHSPTPHSPNSSHPRGALAAAKTRYVPILDLPAVRSHELWRLRPEFGVAIRCALGEAARDIETERERAAEDEQSKHLSQLEDLVTVADIKSDSESSLYHLFSDSSNTPASSQTTSTSAAPQPLFLVDHNAPSIPGMSDETIRTRFTVVGCVDHHVDEGYVGQDVSPRIITTGIGSCASLVVKHLRDQGMWSTPLADSGADLTRDVAGPTTLEEISRLALAPILIDTTNLKGKGDKCSDTDREAVAFLESVLSRTPIKTIKDERAGTKEELAQRAGGGFSWDRDAFYHAIATAKANSLNLLTMQETFDRDYKVWREPVNNNKFGTSSSSAPAAKEINIGMSSLVKPLSWLVKHAGGVDKFVDEIETFAKADPRDLGVFAMLTRAAEGKEVVVLALDEGLKGLISQFEDIAGELQLREWDEDQELKRVLGERVKGDWKVWWMGDTSKSRKQVGPLLREAVRG